MQAIHEYIVMAAQKKLSPTGRLLDYGCGRGEIVVAARDCGIEAYGCDVFYAGGSYRAEVGEHLGTIVLEMKDEVIPFPDAHFDCVIANQVFEHIDDWSRALAEIDRVLKPSGVLLALFPTLSVWREGHIGIPFVHWFNPKSKLRRPYTWFLRHLGLGLYKHENESVSAWTDRTLAWIDSWTFYITYGEIVNRFSPYFSIEHREVEYFLFRLARTRLRVLCPAFARMPLATQFICRHFSGEVFDLEKLQPRPDPIVLGEERKLGVHRGIADLADR